MKAVLSNRLYIELSKSDIEKVKEELTYTIPVYGDGPPIIIRNFKNFKSTVLSIPIGRTDLIPSNHTIVDKRVTNPVEFPEFKFTLRESQQEIHDSITDNCLINAKVGWGKTFMALALAKKLGQKTLIVVHTLALMHQWAKEVEKVFGFKPGLIGDKHNNTNEIIVIGNVASLYKRMHLLNKEFGTVIMDEVHHAPSPTFSKVIDLSYARYKIGLSGTLIRKDGLHVLLKDYFSNEVFRPPQENVLIPEVHVYDTGVYLPDGQIWANRITGLYESEAYKRFIKYAVNMYTSLGHKVLFISDRVDLLKYVSENTNSALIIGETLDREAEFAKLDSGETNSLAGSLSIFKEGISYNPFSCVILGALINNDSMLEQVIGRIQRQCDNKLSPIVVDPKIRGYSAERQLMARIGHYIREGYKIKYF